ncbi:hypothetical protein Hanom_Chr08g00697841 [Helianthus anomalus]
MYVSNLYTRLCFCIELYFQTCYRLMRTMLRNEVAVMMLLNNLLVSSRCFRHRLGCDTLL